MNTEDKIRQRAGTNPGYRVPDNYFADFASRTMQSLPPRSFQPEAPRLTTWQKIRPYVYLAAMFAGIWCMMKMFHTMSSTQQLTLDNPPSAMAEASIEIPNFEELYANDDSYADYEVISDLSYQYDDISEFKSDFAAVDATSEADFDLSGLEMETANELYLSSHP